MRGGTIINIITAVIFFGLLAFSILWIIKQFGQAGQQYSEVLIDTSHKASAMKCQMNMRSIYQTLQVYAMENEKFPSSQQELVSYCGDSRLFRCSEPNTPTYVYIPGQRNDMPPTNVLVYEPEPVHEGKSVVLFLNGQIAVLAPDELRQAIAVTAGALRRGR
ncbi:MAG: hypothetical protein JW955_25885 [Sedimentisphaerales bacterium]|nr:hypothetical protein [Sedimentisphaerales bacterium]